MCGIAGWFGALDVGLKEDWVNLIASEQFRRGPDHREVRAVRGTRSHAVLGHNRLAIIDLSAAANQPMADGTGRTWLTYNGEIYNYRELRSELETAGVGFRTKSDTEVLLAAWHHWGPEALNRLNGMFAFGLYDRGSDTLHLVRDRFGVKPLYYATAGGGLLFASSPGAIARCIGAAPSLDYASRGLTLGIYEDDSASSPYEGVWAVPAGCRLQANVVENRVAPVVSRWYDLESRVEQAREEIASVGLPNLVDRTIALLESAVQLRLRADVPVGVSLSGGIDSSAVAALAQQHGEVIGFSFGAPSEERSEGPVVARTISELKIQAEFVPSGRGRVLADSFDMTLAAQDAPFLGCPVIAQFAVCRAARAAGVRVLLGGQGGDESFMGYQKFKLFRASEQMAAGEYVGALATAWGSIRSLAASGFGPTTTWRQLQRYRGRGRSNAPAALVGSLKTTPPLGYRSAEPLWRRQARDVTSLSLPTLLRYEDRNSMGNSIETRLPLVDFRVVEFGLALPEALKIRHGFGKWILRAAMEGRIPDNVRMARGKRGFDADHPFAITSGLGAVIRERLYDVAGELQSIDCTVADIDRQFADDHLIREPSALVLATTLIWLGQRMGGWRPPKVDRIP